MCLTSICNCGKVHTPANETYPARHSGKACSDAAASTKKTVPCKEPPCMASHGNPWLPTLKLQLGVSDHRQSEAHAITEWHLSCDDCSMYTLGVCTAGSNETAPTQPWQVSSIQLSSKPSQHQQPSSAPAHCWISCSSCHSSCGRRSLTAHCCMSCSSCHCGQLWASCGCCSLAVRLCPGAL